MNSSLFSSNFTSISVIIKEKSYLGANIYDSGSISFRHANVKTAIAVMLCILLFQFFHRGSPMIACLAAVFSLRQDLNTSLSFGKSRIIETHWVAFSFAFMY